MMEGLQILKVTDLGETPAESNRVSISPMELQMTSSREDIRNGFPCWKVILCFKDGGQHEIFVSEYDLFKIEEAIATYGFTD